MSAGKVLSDLQWVEEKLLRPFGILVQAMREAAEVEQGLVGKKELVESLAAQVLGLESKITAKRDELQTLDTTARQRITDTTHRMERTQVDRMHALDAEFNLASRDHHQKLAQMTAEQETYRESLEQTKVEYKGAHHKLQAEHDAAVEQRRQEITRLTEELTAVKTKHANFLKEVGHVVH